MFLIGKLSQFAGVSTQTIRYYERIALLPAPRRSENGYRIYDDTDIDRLRFIKQARQLNFSLDDIAEILALRERNQAPCSVVMNKVAQQIEEINSRIAELIHLQNELKRLYQVGLTMPEDIEMKHCVCHLIKDGLPKEVDAHA
ncbi:MAG: heavy metal-responsive transcriptional regulator [Chloroflexi bacterium]|nr:MAG: heavy metal-responsive transcriptional regulator [Chloroflexota bacterium]